RGRFHLARGLGHPLARRRRAAGAALLALLSGLPLLPTLCLLPLLGLLSLLLPLLPALRLRAFLPLAAVARRLLTRQLLRQLARLLPQPFLLTRQPLEPPFHFLRRQLVLLARQGLLLARQVVLATRELADAVERRVLLHVLGARLDVAPRLVLAALLPQE